MTRGQSKTQESAHPRQAVQVDTDMVDASADQEGPAAQADQEMTSADQESELSENSGSGAGSGFKERVCAAYRGDPNFVNADFTKDLTFKDGIWFKDQTLVVPKVGNLRQECMREMHDTPLSGHMGVTKTSCDCFGGQLCVRMSSAMC